MYLIYHISQHISGAYISTEIHLSAQYESSRSLILIAWYMSEQYESLSKLDLRDRLHKAAVSGGTQSTYICPDSTKISNSLRPMPGHGTCPDSTNSSQSLTSKTDM